MKKQALNFIGACFSHIFKKLDVFCEFQNLSVFKFKKNTYVFKAEEIFLYIFKINSKWKLYMFSEF